mgnify:CR=1 FL=1
MRVHFPKQTKPPQSTLRGKGGDEGRKHEDVNKTRRGCGLTDFRVEMMNKDNTRRFIECIRVSLRLIGQYSHEWIWSIISQTMKVPNHFYWQYLEVPGGGGRRASRGRYRGSGAWENSGAINWTINFELWSWAYFDENSFSDTLFSIDGWRNTTVLSGRSHQPHHAFNRYKMIVKYYTQLFA